VETHLRIQAPNRFLDDDFVDAIDTFGNLELEVEEEGQKARAFEVTEDE
jgi:hypothetical protein